MPAKNYRGNSDIGSTSIDQYNQYFTNGNMAPFNIEEPTVVQRNLVQRASQLNQVILSIQKREIAEKGRSLVIEYQLRTELEALCEDVLFLADKKDRLAETLRDLRKKRSELLNGNGNDDKTGGKQSMGVSDASVQTENWPLAYHSIEWPDPP
mmetsp:Transcript_7334/g.17938  ORF Transcript_7334/g.17938 Transcript_7334/m.17938 type:complete len:153 (+) Transcript_7334:196-654(+)